MHRNSSSQGSGWGLIVLTVVVAIVLILPPLFYTGVISLPEFASENDDSDDHRPNPSVAGASGASSSNGSSNSTHRSNQPGPRSASAAGSDGEEFEPWTRFYAVEEIERAGRLVAGRRDSLTRLIRIQPAGIRLPSEEHLVELAQRLHSDEHRTTYIYFFLPDMHVQDGAWVTAHHVPDEPFQLKYNEAFVPAKYKQSRHVRPQTVQSVDVSFTRDGVSD